MDVASIQKRLTELGLDPGPIDGMIGARTMAAIKQFQSARGLRADGIVGAGTEAAMMAGAPPPPPAPAGLIYPSYADLAPIFPSAKRDILMSYCEALPKVVAGCGVTTMPRAWHFIGQCAHESDHFKTRQEYASGRAYEGRKDLGNVNPGDGVKFKGHAEIQCTGRDNHAKATLYVRRALNDPSIDLVANPMLIVQRADISVAVDCWYWTQGSPHYGNLNLRADLDDGSTEAFEHVLEVITLAINGGHNGLVSRRTITMAVKRVLQRLNGH